MKSLSVRSFIVIAVMSATLMQVLDITIVNVALPHMEGSLGATSDDITWVLTSYLVASAIFMPLTGYFTDVLGRKKYLLYSIAGFVISSALCGAAVNLTQIVVFRLLQGMFGAALVPLSQAIMTDIFPPEERGTAMAIWGMGVMIGPILGPTLGGYLTEIATWRWNFYINVPVGLLSLFLAWQFVPDTAVKQRKMDWVGLALISTTIGCTQYVMDQGNRADWFSSTAICLGSLAAIISLLCFLLHNLEEKTHVVFDLKIFHDKNFVICSSLIAVMGLGLFGGMVIAPLMLEHLMNYPVLTTGLVMAPRGISGMISMLIVGKIIRYVDPRWIIITGIFITGIGTLICLNYNLVLSPGWVVGPFILQGLGMGMIFVPLSSAAFSTLPHNQRSEAAGLFSLMRTLGSSIGISIIITIFTRHAQIAWQHLNAHITPFNPAVNQYLQPLHLHLGSSLGNKLLMREVALQAQMLGFIDAYFFIAASLFIMIPFIFLITPVKQSSALSQHME